MNPSEGFVVAEESWSPWYQTRGEKPQRQPPLSAWSDVTFLTWSRFARNKKELRNIKYFFRWHIVNTNTKFIISEALKRTGQTLSKWPGTEFSMTSEEGKAILGTPNGGGVAWFIVDHKDDFGVKTVKSVRVFKVTGPEKNGKVEDWYVAMFTVAPYTGKFKSKRDSFGLDESDWEYQI